MRPIRTMTCACALLAALPLASPSAVPVFAQAAQPAPPARARSLAGLWKANKRFGPDARGTLLIRRSNGGWTADLAGQILPARMEGKELVFALPGGRGWFRGRPDGAGGITGHWLRPGTGVNISLNGSAVGASPVSLAADGPGRWRGLVEPEQDSFDLYLLARPRPDGSLDIVLRNPERDMGTQIGARRLVVEGGKVRLVGNRPGQAERLLAEGVDDAENDSFSLAFPNRGGTYDFTRDGDDSLFYPRGAHPGAYAYAAPPALGDGWPTATLSEEGIDRAAMERLVQAILATPMDSPDSPQPHALIIARHGRLVLEEYFHGQSREGLHTLRSAAKSITSVLVGAVMRDGAPLSLSSPVYQIMNGGRFPDGLDPAKGTMTLEHLLTMSSGFFCDDTNDDAPGNEELMTNQAEEPDYYRYIMKVELATPPGANSVYCSASPNLALGMVGRATGESPLYAFDRLVARPLGIAHYSWPLDPAGNPYGGGSLALTLRDFAKFGQLMLNGGTWNGRRILDRDYVERSLAPAYHLRKVFYSYLWWIEDYPYKGRVVRSISARGAGGQTVTIIPELELLVATMAGNFSSRAGMMAASNEPIPRLILPAVREKGDDPEAPIVPRDYVSPYGASTDGSPVVRPH
jgi:CubicO group peptidase (beta-lactamase class C family)